MKFTQILAAIFSMLLFTACGGGGGASSPTPAASVPSGTGTSVSQVTISGKVTYDKVPHRTGGMGLDYGKTIKAPARGVVVALMDEKNEELGRAVTTANGEYSFKVKPSIDVKIQVRAQLLGTGQANWDVTVSDNTLDKALFALEGALASTGSSSSQTRDLHAPSGWGETGYTAERAAAPFAILDTVFDAVQAVIDVDAGVSFPALNIYWSPDNRAVIGQKALGHIGTSGYHHDEDAIYLLGEDGWDTDEYDPHVIIHEWGHYFEDHMARLDSMGGLHGLREKLDPRLAFSEGFGNALAGIVTGSPEYRDSSGENQGEGFMINFETITSSRAGWYNEGSVAAIIYDVFDDQADGNDRMSAGFKPIYGAMTDDAFRGSDAFTTIFSFSDALLKQPEINAADYRLLLDSQNISSSDALGAGEKNNGAITSALPVYKTVAIDGAPAQICSVDDAGNFNKLGNRELIFFNIPSDGEYRISLKMTSGDDQRDPDFNLWQAGKVVMEAASSRQGEESLTATLSAGDYVAEAYDFYNINGTSSKRGDACFELSLSR